MRRLWGRKQGTVAGQSVALGNLYYLGKIIMQCSCESCTLGQKVVSIVFNEKMGLLILCL